MNTHLMTELVHRYFTAYVAGDRRAIESLLASDFTFTSAYEGQLDRARYIERCRALAGTFEYHELNCTCVMGDQCFVLHEGKSKSGHVFRNTELFRFDGARIRSVEVFHGRPPSALTAVLGGQSRGVPMALTPSGV